MPDPTITFTDEEVQHLVESGKITEPMLAQLPGNLQKQATRVILEGKMAKMPLLGTSPLATGAAALEVPAAVGRAAMNMGTLGNIGRAVAPAVVQGVASASGHPFVGVGLGHALARVLGRGPGGPSPRSRGTGAPPSPPPAAPNTGPSIPRQMGPPQPTGPSVPGIPRPPSTRMTNSAAQDIMLGRQMPAAPAPKGSETLAQEQLLGRDGKYPSNVQRVRPRNPASGLVPRNAEPDIAEQVQRGVQNDFRGRVTFDRGGSMSAPSRPEFPAGATNKTPPDIYRALEEAAAERGGNPTEIEAIRQFIAKALNGGV